MSSNPTLGSLEQPGMFAGVIMLLLFFMSSVSLSALAPVIPNIHDKFVLSGESARLMISYGFTGYMVGQLAWGPLSDYVGRSAIIIISLVVYILLCFVATLSNTAPELMLSYIAIGFVAATYTSVGQAILKDRYDGDHYVKMVANVGVVMAAGTALGPSLSALMVSLTKAHWQVAFYMLAGIGLIALIGYLSFGRYASKQSATPIEVDSAARLFRNRRYFVALFSFSLPFGITISHLATGPYLLLDYYGIDKNQFPFWFGVTTMLYLGGAVLFRLHGAALTPDRALYWGSIVAAVGAALLLIVTYAFPHDAVPGILSLCLMMVGIGMIIPAGKAATMGQVESAFGLAASIMKFTQCACAVGISAWAALLFSPDGIIPLLLLYSGICVLACFGSAKLHAWSRSGLVERNLP